MLLKDKTWKNKYMFIYKSKTVKNIQYKPATLIFYLSDKDFYLA